MCFLCRVVSTMSALCVMVFGTPDVHAILSVCESWVAINSQYLTLLVVVGSLYCYDKCLVLIGYDFSNQATANRLLAEVLHSLHNKIWQ